MPHSPRHSLNVVANSPITVIARGKLMRAFVSLPSGMCEADRPLQERIVFFESTSTDSCARDLEQLLALAWRVDTTNWSDLGYIYNIYSAQELLSSGDQASGAGELVLLEVGSGGDDPLAVGPDRIHYARSHNIDLFVSPRVNTRLRELMAAVEHLYECEPVRRLRGAHAIPDDSLHLTFSRAEMYEVNDALHEVIERMCTDGQTEAEIEYKSLRVMWLAQVQVLHVLLGPDETPGEKTWRAIVEDNIANPKILKRRS